MVPGELAGGLNAVLFFERAFLRRIGLINRSPLMEEIMGSQINRRNVLSGISVAAAAAGLAGQRAEASAHESKNAKKPNNIRNGAH